MCVCQEWNKLQHCAFFWRNKIAIKVGYEPCWSFLASTNTTEREFYRELGEYWYCCTKTGELNNKRLFPAGCYTIGGEEHNGRSTGFFSGSNEGDMVWRYEFRVAVV